MTASTSPAPSMSASLRFRLSVMMFLQYAIWGAWLPFLWSFLADHHEMESGDIGLIFSVGAVGAIFGPFIAGQIADRYFATERFLALSHLVGAVLIWQLGHVEGVTAFVVFSLIYGALYAPTMSLTNSLAFHHIPDRDRDFGAVRLWGTVGWIVVGLAMGQWLMRHHSPEGASPEVLTKALAAGKADAFRLSAVLGAVMGVFCLTLPHTPPAKNASSSATKAAFGAVKMQPLLTLFLLSIPVSCIHQLYFVHADGFLTVKQIAAPGWMKSIFGAGGGGLMTIGQMSEVVVLGLMPLVIRKLSRKSVLAIGLLAYAARMALFAYVDAIPLPAMGVLIAGLALHGIIFGCFIFLAFIIVDEETSGDIRASVQNLYNLVIIGIGVIVGSQLSAGLAEWSKDDAGVIDYRQLFSAPMFGSLACFVLLLIFYPSKRRDAV